MCYLNILRISPESQGCEAYFKQLNDQLKSGKLPRTMKNPTHLSTTLRDLTQKQNSLAFDDPLSPNTLGSKAADRVGWRAFV